MKKTSKIPQNRIETHKTLIEWSELKMLKKRKKKNDTQQSKRKKRTTLKGRLLSCTLLLRSPNVFVNKQLFGFCSVGVSNRQASCAFRTAIFDVFHQNLTLFDCLFRLWANSLIDSLLFGTIRFTNFIKEYCKLFIYTTPDQIRFRGRCAITFAFKRNNLTELHRSKHHRRAP